MKTKHYEKLSKIRTSSISIRFNHWDNRINMKDTVIKLQAAADDLWSQIMDMEYQKETIEKIKDVYRKSTLTEAVIALHDLDDEIKGVQKAQDMLMNSYSVIMYKIANLCKRENVQSAMERAL